jgi:hypothetical protein
MGEIRPVKSAEIFSAPNIHALLEEYSKECMASIDPQVDLYQAMEERGVLQCFGVYDDEDALAGFASLLSAVMPHNGLKVATAESLFMSAEKRAGFGLNLLIVLEAYAKAAGCTYLLYNVRLGSRLEWVLAHRHECRKTHSVFSARLQ